MRGGGGGGGLTGGWRGDMDKRFAGNGHGYKDGYGNREGIKI